MKFQKFMQESNRKLLNFNSRFGRKTVPYLMVQIDSIDIDSADDLYIAESIIEQGHRRSEEIGTKFPQKATLLRGKAVSAFLGTRFMRECRDLLELNDILNGFRDGRPPARRAYASERGLSFKHFAN